MLDWLRRSVQPTIQLGQRTLPIEVRRLAHARRLTLRLAPDGSAVRVTVPKWAPTREALDFAQGKADWLERQLARLPESRPLGHGEVLHWRGTPHKIAHDPTRRRGVVLVDETLHIGGPLESLSARLRRWVQSEARTLFLTDLTHYAPRAGVPAPALALTNAQRRWGSCSAQGTVRLNWRLGMAPDTVRRSVVAHEVAHLVHFDHSPRFHALLADLFEGDLDAANLWLKRHGRTLYHPLG